MTGTVVHLVSGAGDAYCGSCLYASTLAVSLRQLGCDVIVAPLYTPVHSEIPLPTERLVFFGGINVYLQQKFALFRHLPALFDRWLDRPGLLRWAVARAGTTRPEVVGEMLVSMLQGEDGRQRKELHRLIDWLAKEIRPQLVHLSNALLMGVAKPIAERLAIPVVCSLTGEDQFVEQIPEPHYSHSRRLLAEDARNVAAFVALTPFYARRMTEYLQLRDDCVHVIPPGLLLPEDGAALAERNSAQPDGPPACVRFGYLGRIAPEKGLDQLCRAFVQLARERPEAAIRLDAAGRLDPPFRAYFAQIERELKQANLADRFRYLGELTPEAKQDFFGALEALVLPSTYPESKGMTVLEAAAAGVACLLPNHGAFVDWVEDLGAGTLYEANSVEALQAAMRHVLDNAPEYRRQGAAARREVYARHRADAVAGRVLDLYDQLIRQAEKAT